MYLAKVGYSIDIKRRKRQGLPVSKAEGTANKGLVFSCKARKLFAGGDTSAGRLGTTRMMFRPLFLFVEFYDRSAKSFNHYPVSHSVAEIDVHDQVQKSARPGTLGYGITSRIFDMPVI